MVLGIGLFITIIGLKNAGLVVSNPSTLVSMVDFAQWRNGENTALICGALVGTPTVTTVVESSAGIAAGGRTGMTSFVTAIAFLAAIIFAQLVSIVPAAATAPALISYCLLKVLSRRRCEVEVLIMVIAVVFAFRYAFMTLG